MNIDEAKEMFGIVNENEKVFFARIPRCVILDKSIPLAAKNIYYYLIARCDHSKGPFTWVSQQTIAEDMELARQNINKNIKTLERFGLIAIKKTETNRNVYMIKDVAELYGDYATAPWLAKKEEPTMSRNHDTPCHEIETPPVTKSRHPPVTKSRHKEEEEEEEEIQEEEHKKPGRPGRVCTWPSTDPFAAIFQNLTKLSICKAKFATEEYRLWLKGLMEEYSLTIEDLSELSNAWQEWHNDKTKKPSSPKGSFRTWVQNNSRRNSNGNFGRKTENSSSKPNRSTDDIDYEAMVSRRPEKVR